jgi:hypothetical protein
MAGAGATAGGIWGAGSGTRDPDDAGAGVSTAATAGIPAARPLSVEAEPDVDDVRETGAALAGALTTRCGTEAPGMRGSAATAGACNGAAEAGCALSVLSSADCAPDAIGAAVRSGAGTAGLRWAASTVNRSAADRVRRYPAVYTASTAAELKVTRLFAIFLFETPPSLGAMDRLLSFISAANVFYAVASANAQRASESGCNHHSIMITLPGRR